MFKLNFKKMSAKFGAVALLCLLVFCGLFFAGCSLDDQMSLERDTGYEINSYDVSIVVEEDRTMHVTETIEANFLAASRGIVRYLPIKNDVTEVDEDGNSTTTSYALSYSDFTVLSSSNNSYIVSTENVNFYYCVSIGVNSRFTGTATYSFSYTITMGSDRDSAKDSFYFNIIGSGWDTTIASVSYSITFPTALTDQTYYIYQGKYGADTQGQNYTFTGSTITGSASSLDYGEALTIRTTFEQGYFSDRVVFTTHYVVLLIGLALLALTIFVWWHYRKKDDIVEVVELSPPNNLTPTEAGFLIDGKVDNKDIMALIVYFADKGYVTIEERGKKETVIKKVKDIDSSAKPHEKTFFEALFKNGDEFSLSSKSEQVGRACVQVSDMVSGNRKKYFTLKGVNRLTYLGIFMAVLMGVYSVLMFFKVDFNLTSMFCRLACAVVFLIGVLCNGIAIRRRYVKSESAFLTQQVVCSILMLVSAIACCFCFSFYSDPVFFRIIFLIESAVLIFAHPRIEDRTKEGREILGKLCGLKKYILAAEKDRLEMLVEEDPQVFYHILPYAYVLGVSDKWIDRFEDIKLPAPDWYVSGGNVLSTIIILRALDASLMRYNRQMKSNIASATRVRSSGGGKGGFGGKGGGFSGGGFSGGGIGGGGGGRF